MHASVIICTWNRKASLAGALRSLERMRVPPEVQWEVLIVDNNSADGSAEMCAEFMRTTKLSCRYIFEGRQGKSFALNSAVRQARGAILAFTDDDVEVHEGWLAGMLETFERFQCLGVAGRIDPIWEECERPSWFITEGPYRLMMAIVMYNLGEEPRPVNAPPFGANLGFKRAAFAKYGEFRTDVGPVAGNKIPGEDTEFCRRVMSGGDNIYYSPTAIVFHPVERKRVTKAYFQKWYFDYGRSLVIKNGFPAGARTVEGVPLYTVRMLAGHALRWMTALRGAKRFYFKLCLYETLGVMVQARLLHKAKRPSAVRASPP
jgi:glucosyl-dolichyl phosphate glucuronosyltransferase